MVWTGTSLYIISEACYLEWFFFFFFVVFFFLELFNWLCLAYYDFFACLMSSGERSLVKREGSPAGVVALFAASMAVMFTAAIYHTF
jgi:hypothetical protein